MSLEILCLHYVSQFVRLSDETDPAVIVNLLFDRWNLKDRNPRVILSVTGGATAFNVSRDPLSKFRSGLVKIMESTDAWLVTGGTKTGVMKEVGCAVKTYEYSLSGAIKKRAVCIGIATWGIVHDREKLEEDEISTSVRKYDYVIPKHAKDKSKLLDSRREAFLDPYHTHFILVDDGTVGTYGGEIGFRAKIEAKILARVTDRT